MKKSVWFLVFSLVTSCYHNERRVACDNNGLFEIKNNFLKKEITSYVHKYKIDIKKVIITVVISQNDTTESYLISAAKDDPFAYNNKPFAYSNVNNAWVVFFNAYSSPFDSTVIEKEFLCILEENSIELEKGFMFYNPHYLSLRLRKGIIVEERYF